MNNYILNLNDATKKYLLSFILFFIAFIASAQSDKQIKYSIATANGIEIVYYDGSLDTISNSGKLAGEYIAILTHSGASEPTAVVLKNTIGTLSWSYTSAGTYTITAGLGTLPMYDGKTVCSATLQERGANPRIYAFGRTSDTTATLFSMNSSLTATDPATTTVVAVKIEVYF